MSYRLLREVLFATSGDDPEVAHERTMAVLGRVERRPRLVAAVGRTKDAHPGLAQELLGLPFAGPVGLAAGFDKHAHAPRSLAGLFDFVEEGAVLPRPQAGNDRPRVVRLRGHEALVNRMGFNSEGVEAVAPRLRAARPLGVPLLVNLGKMKETPDDEAAGDYAAVATRLAADVDAFVVNVSSPNTPGLRRLQAPDVLGGILARLHADLATVGAPRPVLVKLAPDLDPGELDATLDVLVAAGAAGVVLGNTTLTRPVEGPVVEAQGGFSGPGLRPLARAMVARAAERLPDEAVIVGCGGVGSGAHALELLRAGADLVQLYTALIYRGPLVPRAIRRDLVARMRAEGIEDIRQVNGRKR